MASPTIIAMTRSPTKLASNMYQQGMKVLFVNLVNVRLPAFITGTLGQQQDDDLTFDINWEGTHIPDDVFEENFDNTALILTGVDKDREIEVRSFVHEARLISYGCQVRDAISFGTEPSGHMFDRSLERFGLKLTTNRLRKNEATRLIQEINAETVNRERPKRDVVEMPIELFEAIKAEAVPKIERAQMIEEALAADPKLRLFINQSERMSNLSPLHKWAYEYETTTTTENPLKGATPSKPKVHQSPATMESPPYLMAPSAASTKSILDSEDEDDNIMGDIIPEKVPTTQSIDELVSSIRASSFGRLRHIAELEGDVETVVAYIIFLMMVVGRHTTSNITMETEHDWYATQYEQRIQFINGYYAAWAHRKDTWDSTKQFRAQDTNNAIIAVMGTITATAIRMTDEHILRALAEGSNMAQSKVYHLLVGRQNYVKPDTDVCKILKQTSDTHQRIGVFETAENGKGRLYDTIIDFLPNKRLIQQLRTPQAHMDLVQYQIPPELVPTRRSITTKKRKSTPVSSPATKRNPRFSVGSSEKNPVVIEFGTSLPLHQDEHHEEEEEGEEKKPAARG